MKKTLIFAAIFTIVIATLTGCGKTDTDATTDENVIEVTEEEETAIPDPDQVIQEYRSGTWDGTYRREAEGVCYEMNEHGCIIRSQREEQKAVGYPDAPDYFKVGFSIRVNRGGIVAVNTDFTDLVYAVRGKIVRKLADVQSWDALDGELQLFAYGDVAVIREGETALVVNYMTGETNTITDVSSVEYSIEDPGIAIATYAGKNTLFTGDASWDLKTHWIQLPNEVDLSVYDLPKRDVHPYGRCTTCDAEAKLFFEMYANVNSYTYTVVLRQNGTLVSVVATNVVSAEEGQNRIYYLTDSGEVYVYDCVEGEAQMFVGIPVYGLVTIEDKVYAITDKAHADTPSMHGYESLYRG